MKRRELVQLAGLSAAGLLVGCNSQNETADKSALQEQVGVDEPVKWAMVTTWPKDFPGLGTGANYLAEVIGKLSGGRIEVTVYGAGEKVAALDVFDAVSSGKAELGHGVSLYWRDRIPAAQFFAAVPFGMTAQEMNSWLYHGGGLELWHEVYAPYNLIPGAAGNTGVQMGGWFNKEIESLNDLVGLKMRMPGLGGEVLKRAGGIPVLIPGGEIYGALLSGEIDATDWVGPHNDMASGLYKAARYYYYPGWHEPGTTQECFINKDAYEALPEDLREIVSYAIRIANQDMLADFTARNNEALEELVTQHNVELRRFPDTVLRELKQLSEQVVAELAGKDPVTKKIYREFDRFRRQTQRWHRHRRRHLGQRRRRRLLRHQRCLTTQGPPPPPPAARPRAMPGPLRCTAPRSGGEGTRSGC